MLLRTPRQEPIVAARRPRFSQDNAPLAHLKAEREPYETTCAECQQSRMRVRQRRRRRGTEDAGQLSGDLCGPLLEAMSGEKYLAVFVKRDTHYLFAQGIKNEGRYGEGHSRRRGDRPQDGVALPL